MEKVPEYIKCKRPSAESKGGLCRPSEEGAENTIPRRRMKVHICKKPGVSDHRAWIHLEGVLVQCTFNTTNFALFSGRAVGSCSALHPRVKQTSFSNWPGHWHGALDKWPLP